MDSTSDDEKCYSPNAQAAQAVFGTDLEVYQKLTTDESNSLVEKDESEGSSGASGGASQVGKDTRVQRSLIYGHA